MKTKIIAFILLGISTCAFAQSDFDSLTIRPAKGDFSIELDFIPFAENGPIDMSTFRGRYFFSQNFALRLGLNIDHQMETYEYPRLFEVNDNQIMKFDKYEMKYTEWGIQMGLEFHLLRNTQVSPYIGIGFGFKAKSSEYSDEENYYRYNYPYEPSFEVVKTDVENGWLEKSYSYDPYGSLIYEYAIQERAFSSWRADIIAGTDIYIMKHFYAGVELGLGFQNIKYKEAIVEEDGVLYLKFKETKDNSFGLNFNNAIRLGFWI